MVLLQIQTLSTTRMRLTILVIEMGSGQEPGKLDYFTHWLCDLGQITQLLQFPLYLLIK